MFDLRICSKKDSTAEFVPADEFWRKRHSGKKAQAVSQGVVYTGSVKLVTSRTKKRTSTEKFLRRTPGDKEAEIRALSKIKTKDVFRTTNQKSQQVEQ